MALFSRAVDRFKQGLAKTREAILGATEAVAEAGSSAFSWLRGRRIDEETLDELEGRLLRADIGVATTTRLVDQLRADYRSGKVTKGEDVLDYLKRELKAMWPERDRSLRFADPGAKTPTVILIAGVNGAGKTTSIAKLAKRLRDENRTVLLAAGDTFRAGAVKQLEIWSQRLGVELVKGQQGGDPAAVAFDACDAAMKRAVDVLIVDTAGRLHTQEPLMRQLSKIREVVAKRVPGAPHETLLVLDATSGQNAIQQARIFHAAIPLSGLILAKLDGTAKGGVAVAIREAIDIPVKFVGVGETLDDLEPFDPEAFVEAMFAS
ncbi:MAG: signal recognition particle-docking protein FtsY [Phycisphaeraceae bacterium]|nr:signal recognition particle-docking protein FtsY [Phycisphaeraceae bacterium]